MNGVSLLFQRECPCGSAAGYDACCGRLHRGQAAVSAVELMRSRYSAFVVGDTDYLFRTWHPRTRPADVAIDPQVRWTGLTILGSGEDWVEFEAHHTHDGHADVLHELSRFERRGGRWTYVDGTLTPTTGDRS